MAESLIGSQQSQGAFNCDIIELSIVATEPHTPIPLTPTVRMSSLFAAKRLTHLSNILYGSLGGKLGQGQTVITGCPTQHQLTRVS